MPDTNCEYCHKPWTGHTFGHIIQTGCPLEEIDCLRSALAASKKREEELRNGMTGRAVVNLLAQLQAKDAEIAGMKEALFKYGEHRSGCVPSYECSCGFKEALSKSPPASLEELKAQIRREALEEAARMAESLSTRELETPHDVWLHGFTVAQKAIATAIRALSPAPGHDRFFNAEVTTCPSCFCGTHTVNGKCGKCGGEKAGGV